MGFANSVVKKENLDAEVKKYGDEILKAAHLSKNLKKLVLGKQFQEILKITQKVW